MVVHDKCPSMLLIIQYLSLVWPLVNNDFPQKYEAGELLHLPDIV